MKVLRPLFLSMLLFIVMCPLFGADLIVYPESPSAAKTSVFTVEVNKTEIPVYDFMDYHYAHFAFSGEVDITVRCPSPVKSHRISPLSLGIQGEVSGSNLKFSMSQAPGSEGTPRYLVLQIDGLGKLVLLGDPPEADAPSPEGEGVFHVANNFGADPTGVEYSQPAIQEAIDAASLFGTPFKPGIVFVPPGIYEVRANLSIKDNVDFYLAPGAVLKADPDVRNYEITGSGAIAPVLKIDGATNATIRGRGEIDGSGVALMNLLSQEPPVFLTQSKLHPRRRVIQSCENVTSRKVKISGIIVKDATGWSVDLVRMEGVLVENVKVLNHADINWKIQNDGINATSSSDVLVNQCFIMTIDDAMCSKARYDAVGSMDRVEFSNSIVWTWAAGVKAGMQNNHPMNNVLFRNIDIVHCRRAIAVDTKTSQDLGKVIPIENVEFEDIRVEEIQGHWKISNHDAVEFLLEDAPAAGITITNLSLPENRPIRCGPTFSAKEITFQNLVMGRELIKSAAQAVLEGAREIETIDFRIRRTSYSDQ